MKRYSEDEKGGVAQWCLAPSFENEGVVMMNMAFCDLTQNNASADSVLLFRWAEPENRGAFLGFRCLKSAVRGNKNTGAAYGGGIRPTGRRPTASARESPLWVFEPLYVLLKQAASRCTG
jgi:hypothetical protein